MNRITKWLNRREGRCEYAMLSHLVFGLSEECFCGYPSMGRKCCVGFRYKIIGEILRSNGITDDGECPLGRIHWDDNLTDEEYAYRVGLIAWNIAWSERVEGMLTHCREMAQVSEG